MLTHLLSQLSLRRLAPLFLAAAICMPLHTSSARVAIPVSPTQPTIMAAPGAGQACVLYQNTKGLGCRDANREEAQQLAMPRDGRDLRIISSPQINQTNGMKIILRATEQLESNPTAK